MRYLALFAVLMLSVNVARAAPASAPADDAAAQVTAAIAEYDKAMSDFSQAYSAATPEARQAILNDKYPQPDKYSPKLLKIAQDNPKTPAAFDALKWIMERDRLPTGASREALDV